MIGYVHTTDTVMAIEERLTDLIEMKEKLAYGPTYEIINTMDIEVLVTSYVIRNKDDSGHKACKIRYRPPTPQKVITPHGFSRHRRYPQLVQMKGPNTCIFYPDRRQVSLSLNLGRDFSPEIIRNRNISALRDSFEPPNASINGYVK